jgi:hypothetical protein
MKIKGSVHEKHESHEKKQQSVTDFSCFSWLSWTKNHCLSTRQMPFFQRLKINELFATPTTVIQPAVRLHVDLGRDRLHEL